MSTTGVAIAPLICFAVLTTLPFTQGSIRMELRQGEVSKMFEVDDADAVISDHSNLRVERFADSVDPTRSFLAGEDTPVWLAYSADPSNEVQITYEKLEKGIVKEAIDYWKSNEFKIISKQKRSVDDNVNLLKEHRESFAEHEDTNNVRSPISRVPGRQKRETNWNVYHPSILAVMEYEHTWPSDKKDERNLILDQIIYALAYWNDVDIQLRPIENPWVRLRLAGIVIGRHRDVTHHFFQTYGDKKYLHYERTLQPMVEYWGDKMRRNVDFQNGTYNIVALMTDAKQVQGKEGAAVSTDGLPCNRDNPGATGVLITYDDLKFSGLEKTVHSTVRILGHGLDNNYACMYKNDWNSRVWDACNLDSIRKSLDSNGWCMKDPQEFHDPGNPVEIILPGSIMSWEGQCNAIIPQKKKECPNSNCNTLRCRTKGFGTYPCVTISHPAMDGSICGEGKICLNAECVVNTLVTYAWMDSSSVSS